MLGVLGQHLRDANARDVGVDDAIRPAIFGRSIGLGIVGFELTGAAVKPEKNDGLILPDRRILGARPQDIGQRQAKQTHETRFESGTPCHSLTIARGDTSLYLQQGRFLSELSREQFRRWESYRKSNIFSESGQPRLGRLLK